MTKSNRYKTLLIDNGNSYLKMAIYCGGIEQQFVQVPSKSNVVNGLNKFKNINSVTKVFILTNNKPNKLLSILKLKLKKATIKIINSNDFKSLIDLSNVKKGVTIGNDIMLLKYWASRQKNIKSVICLGSIYFAIVSNGKKFKTVMLLPSFVKGLEQVENQTSIPSKLLPNKFDKTAGLNTPDAFAAGLNLAIKGFVDQTLKTYKLDKKQLVITGGDCKKYQSLKSYNIIEHLTIKALALLIKEKKW